MSGARRALGGLRPRGSRERRLQPEELTGHALRLRSFRPQQPDLPRWEGGLYGEICPGSSRSLHSHPSPTGVFGRIKNVLGAEEGVKGIGRETARPLLVRPTLARARVAGPAPLAHRALAVVLETFAAPLCRRSAQAYPCALAAADTRAPPPAPT